MWRSSFGRTVFMIVLVIVALLVVIIGLRVYGQYWGTTSTTPTPAINLTPPQTNTTTLSGYVPTVDDDPAIGATQPKVTIISFEDFQCPYCREAAPILKQLVQEYPTEVKFVFRDFPLYTVHPQATSAAQASECADEQNQFWPWHDLVYAQSEQLVNGETAFFNWAEDLGLNETQFKTCFESAKYEAEVEKDLNSGILAGVTATPTYFVNGYKIEGVLTLEQWREVVEQLLAKS